jgi:hypothetical protein
MPIGKKSAPAIKNPHIDSEKQVKICVNHANKQRIPTAYAMIKPCGHLQKFDYPFTYPLIFQLS